jgi:dUTP pyrophosphatase
MSAPIQLDILVTKLDNDAVIPTYAKPGDAGADLYSISELVLAPGERALVKTGIAIALPNGYVGLVHPRSGLGLKNGISVVNTPGTIDAGYRGEIGVVLINHDLTERFQVKKGDRIAQLVIQKVENANFKLVNQLPDSERSAGGYGSTGV